MRVVVTGAAGVVGSRLVPALRARGHEVCALTRADADLTSHQALQVIAAARAEVIINCAAIADVDRCEREPAKAWAINAEVPARLAQVPNAHLLHVSTDYVFDGAHGPYDVDAVPNPQRAYALGKCAGELAVRALASRWSIVRTAVVYGWKLGRSNFASQVIEALAQGKTVRAFTDQWITPTHVSNAVEQLVELAERQLPGVWHAAGAETIDRFTFAHRIAQRLGLDPRWIEPSRLADSKGTPRPPRAGLNVSRTLEALSAKPLDLAASLNRLHAEFTAEGTP